MHRDLTKLFTWAVYCLYLCKNVQTTFTQPSHESESEHDLNSIESEYDKSVLNSNSELSPLIGSENMGFNVKDEELFGDASSNHPSPDQFSHHTQQKSKPYLNEKGESYHHFLIKKSHGYGMVPEAPIIKPQIAPDQHISPITDFENFNLGTSLHTHSRVQFLRLHPDHQPISFVKPASIQERPDLPSNNNNYIPRLQSSPLPMLDAQSTKKYNSRYPRNSQSLTKDQVEACIRQYSFIPSSRASAELSLISQKNSNDLEKYSNGLNLRECSSDSSDVSLPSLETVSDKNISPTQLRPVRKNTESDLINPDAPAEAVDIHGNKPSLKRNKKSNKRKSMAIERDIPKYPVNRDLEQLALERIKNLRKPVTPPVTSPIRTKKVLRPTRSRGKLRVN